MRTFIIAILSLGLLSACGTKEVIRVVEKQVMVPVELDPRLFRDCPMPTPPDQTYYMSLNISERETVLALYSKDLMLALDRCGMQIGQIKRAHDAAIKKIREAAVQ